MNIHHIDREKNPPTLVGPGGCAWEIDRVAARAAAGWTEERDATVAGWVVFAPLSHPFWPYHLVGAIHLRPLPGEKSPAKIYLPGATHEVIVHAIDPTVVPSLVNPRTLRPTNFIGQWIVRERRNPVDLDRVAAAKIRGCVEEILAGQLSPDTDDREQWILRFSDSNILQ